MIPPRPFTKKEQTQMCLLFSFIPDSICKIPHGLSDFSRIRDRIVGATFHIGHKTHHKISPVYHFPIPYTYGRLGMSHRRGVRYSDFSVIPQPFFLIITELCRHVRKHQNQICPIPPNSVVNPPYSRCGTPIKISVTPHRIFYIGILLPKPLQKVLQNRFQVPFLFYMPMPEECDSKGSHFFFLLFLV